MSFCKTHLLQKILNLGMKTPDLTRMRAKLIPLPKEPTLGGRHPLWAQSVFLLQKRQSYRCVSTIVTLGIRSRVGIRHRRRVYCRYRGSALRPEAQWQAYLRRPRALT